MASTTTHKYDIREIRMVKLCADLDFKLLAGNKTGEACYLGLGHFDLIQLNPITVCDKPTSDPFPLLEAVSESLPDATWKKPISNAIHSLFVIKELGKEDITLFWEKPSLFLLVARIHCDLPPEEDGERREEKSIFIKKLTQCCEHYLGDNPPISEDSYFERRKGEWTIRGCFYESLEMGDIVGVFQCDELLTLLNLGRRLYEENYVRDIYSYIGVHYGRLHSEFVLSEELAEKMKQITLPYLTSRFSVRNAQKADAYFEKYMSEKEKFYVTGTADAVIRWSTYGQRGTNENAFLKKLKKLLEGLEQNGKEFTDAFNDVITRVGLEYRNPKGESSGDFERIRLEAFDKIIDWRWLYEAEGNNLPSHWAPMMRRLIASLRTMSSNSVMDDLSAMLIPSVRILLERIRKFSKWSDPHWDLYSEEICYFLDSWARLTDDLLQLESQLTQHPELAPLPRAIPAMLLQFQQYFVCQAARYLDDTCSEDSYSWFAPVLFPSTTDHIVTRCVLDPRGRERAGCLLCIETPVKQLYAPYAMTHILVHEVAHYVGNETRKRDMRLKCLCHCMAIMTGIIWKFRLKESSLSVDKEIDSSFYSILGEKIESEYRNSLPPEVLPDYLDVIQEYIVNAVTNVACKYTEFEVFLKMSVSKLEPEKQLYIMNWEYWIDDYDWFSLIITAYKEHFSLLLMLVKECYADLAMIHLLNCSFETYYESVFQVEFNRLKDLRCTPDSWQIRQHIYRMFLVADTVDKQWIKKAKKKEKEIKEDFECFSDEPDDKKLMFLSQELNDTEKKDLCAYLKACWSAIQSQSRGRLDKELSAVTPNCVNWGAMRRFSEEEARKWRTEA